MKIIITHADLPKALRPLGVEALNTREFFTQYPFWKMAVANASYVAYHGARGKVTMIKNRFPGNAQYRFKNNRTKEAA